MASMTSCSSACAVEIDVNDDLAVFEARADLLIEHRHDTRTVRPDFIARDVQIFDLSGTFQINRDFLEGLPFGVVNTASRVASIRVSWSLIRYSPEDLTTRSIGCRGGVETGR